MKKQSDDHEIEGDQGQKTELLESCEGGMCHVRVLSIFSGKLRFRLAQENARMVQYTVKSQEKKEVLLIAEQKQKETQTKYARSLFPYCLKYSGGRFPNVEITE